MRGARIAYSADERAFVEKLAGLPRILVHAAFQATFDRPDVTVDHIKGLCSRNRWATRRPWSSAEHDVLRAHFPNMPTARVAAMLGRAPSAVSQRASFLGVTKSAAYLASEESGRLQHGSTRGGATRFKKGQVPRNKGMKYPKGWAPGRMRETQFTKGQAGWNWKPIGAERIIGGYRYTKVSDHRRVPHTVNWKATHILRWEAVNGPVPDGHALKCLNGDRCNVDASNWQAVPRALLPRLNGGRGRKLSFDAAPEELKPTIMAVAQLEHAVRRRSKERAA